MHPSPKFRVEADWLAFADAHGFAHIFAVTPEGPMVIHAPVSLIDGALHFHVFRANRAAAHLDGAQVVVSISVTDGYISPNWYADTTNQVPTWNYLTIEIEGVTRAIDEAKLITQLDALTARHEVRANPTDPWTRDKMDEAAFRKLLRAIDGFRIDGATVRETVKLGQNKNAADKAGMVAGLRAAGSGPLADAVERA